MSQVNTDILIVGAGPSALILAYILEGNTPFYDYSQNEHPDPVLHDLLQSEPNLLKASNDPRVLERVAQTRGSTFFSSDIQPFNQLLDILKYPQEIDTSDLESKRSHVKWVHNRARADYIIVGTDTGGQWARDDLEYRALSYTQPLSLPGLPLNKFLSKTDPYYCPLRNEVCAYYKHYASVNGLHIITDTIIKIEHETKFALGEKTKYNFNKIVLATGCNSPADTTYEARVRNAPEDRVVVIGSGLGAADTILDYWKSNVFVEHVVKDDHRLKHFSESLHPEYFKVASAIGEGELPLYKRVSNVNTLLNQSYRCGRRSDLSYARGVLNLERGSLLPSFENWHPSADCYVVGSIIGDKTVRYLIGGCCCVAGDLLQ